MIKDALGQRKHDSLSPGAPLLGQGLEDSQLPAPTLMNVYALDFTLNHCWINTLSHERSREREPLLPGH